MSSFIHYFARLKELNVSANEHSVTQHVVKQFPANNTNIHNCNVCLNLEYFFQGPIYLKIHQLQIIHPSLH